QEDHSKSLLDRSPHGAQRNAGRSPRISSGLQVHDFSTSSGSVPLGLPLASRVIFSTRASAWRSNSSQRRLSASPRSQIATASSSGPLPSSSRFTIDSSSSIAFSKESFGTSAWVFSGTLNNPV